MLPLRTGDQLHVVRAPRVGLRYSESAKLISCWFHVLTAPWITTIMVPCSFALWAVSVIEGEGGDEQVLRRGGLGYPTESEVENVPRLLLGLRNLKNRWQCGR